MNNWEIIADNLSKAGWSWGWVSAVDCCRRTSFFASVLFSYFPFCSFNRCSVCRLAMTKWLFSPGSSSRDPEAHPAPRQIANRSCPSVGVGGNRGLREKHPTQPLRSDLALAVHFGTRIGNHPCGMGRNLPIARSKCDFPFE